MIDPAYASSGHRSALIGFRPRPRRTSVIRGYPCLPLAVRDLFAWILARAEANLTGRSHALVFGESFSCFLSFWERLRLLPALSRPLSARELRPWNAIA